jgi:hypothetical protein
MLNVQVKVGKRLSRPPKKEEFGDKTKIAADKSKIKMFLGALGVDNCICNALEFLYLS